MRSPKGPPSALDHVSGEVLARAWAAGTGPGDVVHSRLRGGNATGIAEGDWRARRCSSDDVPPAAATPREGTDLAVPCRRISSITTVGFDAYMPSDL